MEIRLFGSRFVKVDLAHSSDSSFSHFLGVLNQNKVNRCSCVQLVLRQRVPFHLFIQLAPVVPILLQNLPRIHFKYLLPNYLNPRRNYLVKHCPWTD